MSSLNSDSKEDDYTEVKKFRMGEKVEANYKSRGVWRRGTIISVKGSTEKTSFYDIRYEDDGREEIDVTVDCIRSLKVESRTRADSFEARSQGADSESRIYRLGEQVEARKDGGVRYQAARIHSVNRDGTYDLKYNDGTEERFISSKLIRSMGGIGATSRPLSGARRLDEETKGDTKKRNIEYNAGDKVEGNYRGRGKWYPGKITRDRGDGTFDISYDDGESETRVEKDLIRLKDGDVKKPARLEEGSKVEGNYRGRGKWYPGKITRDRGDGTYDISYDDGESETRVEKDLIRLKDSGEMSSPKKGSRFEEGDKVEGNYRGRGKWYPGKITRDRGDGTYDI